MARSKDFGSGSGSFPANNIVPFDHCGNAHSCSAVFHSALHSHHFAQSSDENLGTLGYLRGKCHCNVQLRTRLQILIHHKIQAACGNIAGLSLLRIRRSFRRHPDDDWQGQVIASSWLNGVPSFPHPPNYAAYIWVYTRATLAKIQQL